MKKIEGNEKQVCTELYKRIYTVLSDEMPNDVIDRCISFEWCKSGKYLGQCILRPNSHFAVVQISSMFDFSRDTVAHEILHALLPFDAKHGTLFKKATAVINDALNLNITVIASRELSQTCKKAVAPYKYAIVNKETGELLLRFKRYCKTIKACLCFEATDPTWNYTVIPYDDYLATKKETKTKKIACAINDNKSAKQSKQSQKASNGIIVKSANAVKIAAILDESNGQSRERLADCTDVALAVDTLDRKFMGINKEGLKIDVNSHAQSFANSYKGIPMTTTFVLLYKYSKWRLLSANRVPCGTVHFRVLHMEPETRSSILRQFEMF